MKNLQCKLKKENEGVPIAQAALAFGRHPATLRRWVRDGAPCLFPGLVGRGKGALVKIEDIKRWRAGDIGHFENEEPLAKLAVALLDTLKRDCAHERVGITKKQAAGLLALAFERAWKDMTHRPLDELEKLPAEIKQLCSIFVE